MIKINATDRHGTETAFEYKYSSKPDIQGRLHIFDVYAPGKPLDESFHFTMLEIQDGVGKIIAMYHQSDPAYTGKGLPERMIAEAANKLGLQIWSSSNIAEVKISPNEQRTPDATRYWERLVVNGLAKYVQVGDFYVYGNTSTADNDQKVSTTSL